MDARARHTPGRSFGGWKAAAGWWLAAAALCVWCGCSVTRENYATLSYFFDGVPDPDARGPAGAAPGDKSFAEAVVVHPPFAQEKCEACHKTQYRPSRNDPSICLACHKDLTQKHTWTHGAVAGGACIWCHSPHESPRKWLLRGPDRKICMQCHAATLLNGSAVPAHADAKVGCLECHFGHGGDNSLMLRVGATAAGPPAASAGEAKPESKPKSGPESGPVGDAARPVPSAVPPSSPSALPPSTPPPLPPGTPK